MRRCVLRSLVLLFLPVFSAASSSFQAATFRVTSVVPAPGAVLTSAPTAVDVQMSDTVDPASVDPSSVNLVWAGPDQTFDTADDVVIAPGAATAAGNSIHIDLTGVPLAAGAYRLTLLGNAPISAGRVGWWKFDEASGTVAKDSSGHGNHGTLGGNPQWQPTGGRVGGALNFDGNGDSVFVPRSASLEPLGSMSVTLWAKIANASGSFTDIVRKAGSNQPGYLVRWYHFDDHLQWRLDRASNPPIYVADPQPTSAYFNAWHHIAGVWDSAAGTSSLYVDGVLRNSAGGFTGNLEHTDDLYFMGSYHPGQLALAGLLDEVRIYSQALAVAEVQRLASAASDEGVSNLAGSPVDGEFGGTFPSGNGVAGGDFVSTFVFNSNLPPAPTLLIARPDGAGHVDLAWTDNSTGEQGFRIERSADGSSFAEIAVVGPDVTSYADLVPLTTGFYRVRAFNASGNSGYSNPAAATVSGAGSTLVINGGCGLCGLEPLLALAILAALRRRRGPGIAAPSRR